MSHSKCFARLLIACGLAFCISNSTYAAVSTADVVVNYSPGDDVPSSYWGEAYSDYYSTAPLGLPDASINLAENDAEGIYPDDSIVTPFSGQYNPANIVAIAGNGGMIELHMSQPISTSGFTLGVHTGAGLYDPTFSGVNSDPAANYTNPRSATVMVSEDGITFYPVPNTNPATPTDFNNPTNIYTDVDGPYTSDPGATLANFAQPFTGDLSSFDGRDFAGTLGALDGSAGGTWLDLSSIPLSEINYVEFQTVDGQTMYIDSVVGVPVPEPTLLGLGTIALLTFKRCRH